MGGAKDSIPPMLTKANPTDSATNVTATRIVLEFSEYIQMQSGAQQQIMVSPVPEVQPIIEARLKCDHKTERQPEAQYHILDKFRRCDTGYQ
jgi:hypothetical protein